jgi:hypothetical protein
VAFRYTPTGEATDAEIDLALFFPVKDPAAMRVSTRHALHALADEVESEDWQGHKIHLADKTDHSSKLALLVDDEYCYVARTAEFIKQLAAPDADALLIDADDAAVLKDAPKEAGILGYLDLWDSGLFAQWTLGMGFMMDGAPELEFDTTGFKPTAVWVQQDEHTIEYEATGTMGLIGAHTVMIPLLRLAPMKERSESEIREEIEAEIELQPIP